MVWSLRRFPKLPGNLSPFLGGDMVVSRNRLDLNLRPFVHVPLDPNINLYTTVSQLILYCFLISWTHPILLSPKQVGQRASQSSGGKRLLRRRLGTPSMTTMQVAYMGHEFHFIRFYHEMPLNFNISPNRPKQFET